jgi:capsular polysaccharide transport system ATP-binding protein
VIHVRGVTKYHLDAHLGHEVILRDASFSLPTNRPAAILGSDVRAISMILLMLTGARVPHKGEIDRGRLRCSPVIHSGGAPGPSLHPQLTAADNIRIFAELYGADVHELMGLVESACELGPRLKLPVSKLDWAARRVLELSVIAALPFDCYFIDRLDILNGPLIWRLILAAQRRGAGLIFSTQRRPQAARLAKIGVLIEDGAARMLYNLEESLASHG